MPNNPPADEVLDLCDEMGIMVLASLPEKSNPCVVALPQVADFEAVEELLDACAMPRECYWLYRSQWNDRKDTIRLLPHWNWDGREGEKVAIVCYTSGDEAELFVNGESAGRMKKATDADAVVGKDDPNRYKLTERYRLVWEVPYEPGEIKVIAFRNGRTMGEDSCKTAYKAAAVKLTPEQTELADGEFGFVKIEMEDDDGTVLPLANDRVNFKIDGPGEIVAVGNGDKDGQDLDASSHPLYYGRALVVVRRNGGSGLPLKLTASAPSVRSASVTFSRR
jgi:beta-galactosidase